MEYQNPHMKPLCTTLPVDVNIRFSVFLLRSVAKQIMRRSTSVPKTKAVAGSAKPVAGSATAVARRANAPLTDPAAKGGDPMLVTGAYASEDLLSGGGDDVANDLDDFENRLNGVPTIPRVKQAAPAVHRAPLQPKNPMYTPRARQQPTARRASDAKPQVSEEESDRRNDISDVANLPDF
jgi:hypothetical protein